MTKPRSKYAQMIVDAIDSYFIEDEEWSIVLVGYLDCLEQANRDYTRLLRACNDELQRIENESMELNDRPD